MTPKYPHIILILLSPYQFGYFHNLDKNVLSVYMFSQVCERIFFKTILLCTCHIQVTLRNVCYVEGGVTGISKKKTRATGYFHSVTFLRVG